MSFPGECLAAFLHAQGRPVHRAAGVVWWEPAPGLLEPVMPQIALDEERRNVELLLALTGRRRARFAAAAEGEGELELLLWRPSDDFRAEAAEAEIAPLAAWQLPDRRYAELVARHDAWSALGAFDERGALTAYLVTCLDDGWLHEVASSGNAEVDALRRHWQAQIQRTGECVGMAGGPPWLGFTATGLRWRTLRRGWRPFASLAAGG